LIKSYDRKKIVTYNIIILAILFFFIVLPNKDTITKICDKNSHFNIFTAISIFCGFLFTGLSILISSSNTWVYKVLNQANRIDKIYFSIYLGLSSGCLSMIISLFLAFSIIRSGTFFIIVEFILLFLTIFNFILSLFYLISIINNIKDYQK
jgi:ABC-type Fe3+ transport system permease subunit